jgi:hypothetical protein
MCNGWCRNEYHRRIAMSVVMDSSVEHDRVFIGGEAADGLPLAVTPFARGRSIVYQMRIKKLVVTGHVLVACCYEIGSFLVKLRRD